MISLGAANTLLKLPQHSDAYAAPVHEPESNGQSDRTSNNDGIVERWQNAKDRTSALGSKPSIVAFANAVFFDHFRSSRGGIADTVDFEC